VNGGAAIVGSGSYGADAPAGEAVGAYRFLGGKGYLPKSAEGSTAVAFVNDPMIAASPSTYNRSEATSDTVVVYADSSVGRWCSQCHQKMHDDPNVGGTAVKVHPNDETLKTTITAIYNNYKSTDGHGTLTGYTSLIPVAYDGANTSNAALVGKFTQGGGVGSSDRVMCLSCHRAHASGFESMMRFPVVEVMTYEDEITPGLATYATNSTNTRSAVSWLSPADMQKALYDRPATVFGIEQRALCNKCHAKD
jgi:hypothetical protein